MTGRLGLVLIPALLLGAVAPSFAAEEESFYKGKQIDLLVGSTPGDAYDFFARIVARVMGRYIPGNPSFVIKNMPGAGGLTVSNYLYNTAARNGTVIASTSQNVPVASLLAPSGVRYDPTKFSWIGSIARDVFVAYVWHSSAIRSLEDLKTKEGIFGANAVGSAGIDFPLLVRDILGLKLKVVSGYGGQPDVRVAMERGEIDGSFGNGWGSLTSTQPSWVPEGKVRLLAQFGLQRLPDIPGDVPVLLDLIEREADRQAFRLVTARQEFSKPYLAPPEIPADRLTMLRTAFDATIIDPQFIEEAHKAGLLLGGSMTGAELADMTVKLSQTPRPVVERIQAIFRNFQNGK